MTLKEWLVGPILSARQKTIMTWIAYGTGGAFVAAGFLMGWTQFVAWLSVL